ncbi:hypothetical protein FB446DRAFT_701358 [Lentinula raphanica]|nr:hypothetical protein FB446DRAFT_701358 [Lentinula raphanica]
MLCELGAALRLPKDDSQKFSQSELVRWRRLPEDPIGASSRKRMFDLRTLALTTQRIAQCTIEIRRHDLEAVLLNPSGPDATRFMLILFCQYCPVPRISCYGKFPRLEGSPNPAKNLDNSRRLTELNCEIGYRLAVHGETVRAFTRTNEKEKLTSTTEWMLKTSSIRVAIEKKLRQKLCPKRELWDHQPYLLALKHTVARTIASTLGLIIAAVTGGRVERSFISVIEEAPARALDVNLLLMIQKNLHSVADSDSLRIENHWRNESNLDFRLEKRPSRGQLERARKSAEKKAQGELSDLLTT